MSFFMTIGGRIPQAEVPAELELLAANSVQHYIAELESDLLALDGGPVMLVHDKETGTSDLLIADLLNALQERRSAASLPVVAVMRSCLKNATNFRIWWAGGNHPEAHIHNVARVDSVSAACDQLMLGKGVSCHAS